jgi:hypothetical protein
MSPLNARLRKKFAHHPSGLALHADERQPSYSKQIIPWRQIHQTLRSCRDFSMPLATDQSRQSQWRAWYPRFCSLWFWLGWPLPRPREDGNDAIRAFVEKVNEASVGFFVSGSEADARERCRVLLAWAFDVPAMGQDALGRAWNTATEAERREFLQAFEEDVISAYLKRMRAQGTTLTFIGCGRPSRDINLRQADARCPARRTRFGFGGCGLRGHRGALTISRWTAIAP